MNKTIKDIMTRVSCREYSDKKVSLTKINDIVEAGKMAPSACNRQIMNILVVRSKAKVNRLRQLSLEVANRDCFYGAQTMVIVYGPRGDKFTQVDGAVILENMFVAANSLKVNSCWINQVDELFNTPQGAKVRKAFGMNENDQVVGTCILGFKKEGTNIEVKPRKADFIKII